MRDSTGPVTMTGDWLAAGAAGLGALLLYATTACRSLFTGDSPELAGAAACFGVPHPPGYPLYTFLTALWVHLFPLAQRAFAANLASSIHGALAVTLTFLLARRLGLARPAAWFAAISLGLGRTVWGMSVAAEVYSFDLLLLLAAAHAAWSVGQSGSGRSWWVAGLGVGLWLGHRFINVWYLPVLFLIAHAARQRAFVAAAKAAGQERPGATSRWGRTLRLRPLAAGFALSTLPFLYLPLASAGDPPIDVGDPETLSRFWTVVRGAPDLRHLAGTTATLALGRVAGFAAALPVESGLAALLAVAGAWLCLRRPGKARVLAAGLLLLLVTNQALTSLYNILDIRSYHLPSLLALALLGAFGVDAIRGAIRGHWRAIAVVPLLVGAGMGLLANFRSNDVHAERAAHQRAQDLLASVAPDALLLVQGDTETHSVWYLQGIEGHAPRVLVVSLGHVSGWYFDELRSRYPQDPIPAYRDGTPPAAHYLRLLEAVGRERPVFFGFDPGEFSRLAPGAWWGERTIVPVGLALEAYRKDRAPDRDAIVAADVAFWGDARTRAPQIEPGSDFETQMIGLEYALAMLRTAEFMQRNGRNDEAAELFRAVLELRPSRWEREMIAAYRSIGRHVPGLDLEPRAARALQSLGK